MEKKLTVSEKLIEKMKQEGGVTPSMGSANGYFVRDFCIQLVETALPEIQQEAYTSAWLRGVHWGFDNATEPHNTRAFHKAHDEGFAAFLESQRVISPNRRH